MQFCGFLCPLEKQKQKTEKEEKHKMIFNQKRINFLTFLITINDLISDTSLEEQQNKGGFP